MSSYELEVNAHLLALAGLASAATSRLDSAAHLAEVAGMEELARQIEKVREFQRLYSARIAALLRQTEGGAR